jgi:hypothetical protein
VKRWLVTFAVGIHEYFAPACVVEAETAEAAILTGVQRMAGEDEGSSSWGVECQHCESIAPSTVGVVEADALTLYEQSEAWELQE